MTKFVLTVACRSTRGIVAAISGFLAEQGCNIVDSSQFDDLGSGRFFMRVGFLSEEGRGVRRSLPASRRSRNASAWRRRSTTRPGA